MKKAIIDVIIPALNEADSVGKVIRDIPKDLVRYILVCNNGSTDQTAEVAKSAGALVLEQPLRGYGNACLKGMEYLALQTVSPDIVVFLDADYSDYPEEMTELIRPVLEESMDLVIGSRALGAREAGSMMPQQRFGNWLATSIIRRIYGYRFTDLGPFRAIRYSALLEIGMRDRNYGWTVEMQVRAAQKKMRCVEVPVRYRRRIGVSKVSGTVKGTIMAGYKILWTIVKLWMQL